MEPIEEQVEEVCERYDFRERLAELGYNLSEESFNSAFVAFKEAGYTLEDKRDK